MMITKKHLPRRTFLRGIGATLALPLLEAMVPAATQVAIGRVMKASGVLVPDTESRTTEVLPVTEYPASTPPPPKRP